MATMGDLLAISTTQAQMSSFFIDKIGIASIASYGAAMDGVTDDSQAANDAADALVEAHGGGIVFIPAGVTSLANVLMRAGVYFVGAGGRATIINQQAGKSVFVTEGYPAERTQWLALKGVGIEPTGDAVPINFDGASYWLLEDVECIGDVDNPHDVNGFTFNITDTFNGYAEIRNCFIKGFKNNLYGTCNVLRIVGGAFTKAGEYGINITDGSVVTIDGPDIANCGSGGMYLDAEYVNVVNYYGENQANRLSGLYSPNNITFGPNVLVSKASVGRWLVPNGIVHGSQEDKFIDYNGGAIGNNHNSTYGLIANGNFDLLDGSGVPYGWTAGTGVACSAIPDPENTPEGHGDGIRITRASNTGTLSQVLVPQASVSKLVGKVVTMTCYVRATGTFAGSTTRAGILSDGTTLSTGSNFISVSNEPDQWIKYTCKYTVLGTEDVDIAVMFQIEGGASNYLDICGVSAVIGELNWDTHEKAVTSAGGLILGDLTFGVDSKGPTLIDRTTGTVYRLYVNNGTLAIESV